MRQIALHSHLISIPLYQPRPNPAQTRNQLLCRLLWSTCEGFRPCVFVRNDTLDPARHCQSRAELKLGYTPGVVLHGTLGSASMTETKKLQDREGGPGHEVGRTGQYLWRSEPDGKLSASRDGLLMVVHEPASGGFVHFLIFRQRAPGLRAPSLIGSGTQTDLTAAKWAAETMAARAALWA
jgi:hypothetical protein